MEGGEASEDFRFGDEGSRFVEPQPNQNGREAHTMAVPAMSVDTAREEHVGFTAMCGDAASVKGAALSTDVEPSNMKSASSGDCEDSLGQSETFEAQDSPCEGGSPSFLVSSSSSKKASRVPRPMNSFMLFAKDKRAAIQAEHPKMQNKEVSRLLGEAWASLSSEKRTHYANAAAAVAAEHRTRHPDWRFTRMPSRTRKTHGSSSSFLDDGAANVNGMASSSPSLLSSSTQMTSGEPAGLALRRVEGPAAAALFTQL